MNTNRLWGSVAGSAAVLSGIAVLHALPSDAASVYNETPAPRTAARITVNATTHTSAFVIPCSTCILQSTPANAHTGGTEYDAGVLADTAGRRVGHFVIEETGMTPFNNGPGKVQLVGTIVLHGDQLTFQGIEEPPLDGGVAAITGGTGRFAGARGSITYTDHSPTVTHLVLHVE